MHLEHHERRMDDGATGEVTKKLAIMSTQKQVHA